MKMLLINFQSYYNSVVQAIRISNYSKEKFRYPIYNTTLCHKTVCACNIGVTRHVWIYVYLVSSEGKRKLNKKEMDAAKDRVIMVS